SDPRYQREAYVFLRDALDYTTKQQKKTKGASVRHVAGPELLEGVRQYALKEFGPMVVTVLSYWGIKSCEDVGHMVFNLIGAGIFGKTEEDSIDDFKNVFDFHEAFVKPFEPEKRSHPDVPLGVPASAPKVSCSGPRARALLARRVSSPPLLGLRPRDPPPQLLSRRARRRNVFCPTA